MPTVVEDFEWNGDLHLQVEPPQFIKTLEFDKISYPTGFDHQLGYSAPFRVVSEEGE